MTAKTWDVSYEWRAVLILSLAFGLVGVDRFVLPPLFPAMMKDLKLDYQDLGNLVGVLGVAWGLSAILVGNLSDRLGRRRVLVPAVVLFSVLSVLSGFAAGLVSLLVIRAVMGLAEGPVASTGVAVAVEASHPRRRGMNNGFFQCTIALFGTGFAPILATQLLRVTSWRAVFWIVGAPGLLVALFMWFTIREPATTGAQALEGPHKRAPLSAMFKHRNVPLSMIGLLCAMTGVFVLSAVMPNYLVDYLKLNPQQMGFVTSAIGFGGALGQLGLLTLSDFIGRRTATLISFVVAAVFLWLFIHTGADIPRLFVLLSIAAMFNFGALAILAGPIPAEAAPVGLIASVAGLVIGAGEIFGGGIAPSLAGTVAQHLGIEYTLYMALGGQIAGLLVCAFLHETAPRVSHKSSRGSISVLDKARDATH
ncbi:MAG TPA: MFS transporter [Steroidobacteraceae bacterium]|nr:MFS transporter [Steroidobacteraceae bacterium]